MLNFEIILKTSTAHITQLLPVDLFKLYSSLSSLTCGQVDSWILVAVVWTDFLDQSVVCAVERHVDAYDLERFGAHPGDVALGLLLSTRLGRVIVAQNHLFVAFSFLIVHPTVERL